MLEKIINILKYRYTKYILIITLLLICFVGYPAFIKFKMSLPVTVKFDIPQIAEKQKGSSIDIYVPYDLYKDLKLNEYLIDSLGIAPPDNLLTLLSDNKVLYLAAGRAIILDFDKKIAYTFSPTYQNYHYYGKNALLLPNDKVYLFTEIFDSKLNKFFPIADMLLDRNSRTATLLPDKTILVTGGLDNKGLKCSDSEVYDFKLNKYTAVSNMNSDRVGHTATLLKNGKVLIVGGNYKDQPYAELFDYKTRKFYPLNYKGKSRFNHTATLLPDGKVLIIGGIDLSGFTADSETKYSDVEVFDPQTNKFKQIGNLIYPNWEHTSILLKSNKVFITGGGGCNKLKTGNCNAQLYDLKTNKTSLTPGSSLWDSSAIMLKDGKVLIVNNGYLYLKNKIRLYIP